MHMHSCGGKRNPPLVLTTPRPLVSTTLRRNRRRGVGRGRAASAHSARPAPAKSNLALMDEFVLAIGNKNYSSWSLRPWIAMKHAGVPFREVVIPLYRPESS